jgi:hypothetical protein
MPVQSGRVIDVDSAIEGSEVMAAQLEHIADSMRKLTNGRLKEDAIIVLIKELLPRGMKMEKSQIKAVLDAAKRLDTFVRK